MYENIYVHTQARMHACMHACTHIQLFSEDFERTYQVLEMTLVLSTISPHMHSSPPITSFFCWLVPMATSKGKLYEI